MDKFARNQLLAEIASLYYIEKTTQAKIGKDFGYSRSGISRLLNEAEKEGIVEISINFPIQRDFHLEKRLINEYGLQEAFVLSNDQFEYDKSLQLVGRLGAMYMEKHLKSSMVIGIGWGTAIFEVVNSLPYLPLEDVRIVQVLGAIGSKGNTQIDGPEITSFFVNKLNANYQYLNSPLFLDSKDACLSLKSQKQILDTFNLAYQSDYVLLGIGTIDADPHFSSLFRSGFINEKEVLEIKEKGGVCNLCGAIYDENGKFLDIDINHRTMAVDLVKLKEGKPKIIGIVAGEKKCEAVKGALNGGWIDILFTDQTALCSIL